MRLLAIALCLSLCSCAETSVSINGQKAFRTQANFSHMEFHQGNTSLVMDGVNHSDATRAGGATLGTATAGATGIVMAIASKGLVH